MGFLESLVGFVQGTFDALLPPATPERRAITPPPIAAPVTWGTWALHAPSPGKPLAARNHHAAKASASTAAAGGYAVEGGAEKRRRHDTAEQHAIDSGMKKRRAEGTDAVSPFAIVLKFPPPPPVDIKATPSPSRLSPATPRSPLLPPSPPSPSRPAVVAFAPPSPQHTSEPPADSPPLGVADCTRNDAIGFDGKQSEPKGPARPPASDHDPTPPAPLFTFGRDTKQSEPEAPVAPPTTEQPPLQPPSAAQETPPSMPSALDGCIVCLDTTALLFFGLGRGELLQPFVAQVVASKKLPVLLVPHAVVSDLDAINKDGKQRTYHNPAITGQFAERARCARGARDFLLGHQRRMLMQKRVGEEEAPNGPNGYRDQVLSCALFFRRQFRQDVVVCSEDTERLNVAAREGLRTCSPSDLVAYGASVPKP